MATQKRPHVPKAMLQTSEQVIALTDSVCTEHLDEEYAELSRLMAAALARKRPSPLLRGALPAWACGIVYTLGYVNFLFDKTEVPHLPAQQLCALFHVSPSTGASRAREIRKLLKIGPADPAWFRASRLEGNPLAWYLETPQGFIVDARYLPRDLQTELVEAGVIPFLPSTTEGDEGLRSRAPRDDAPERSTPTPMSKKPSQPPPKEQLGFDL